MQTNKILSTNRLVTSEHYPEIIRQYNEWFRNGGGKVNNSKFYREVVKPLLPEYKQISFYQFINKFKTRNGLIAAKVGYNIVNNNIVNPLSEGSISNDKLAEVESGVAGEMLSVQEATDKGIALMMNISVSRLQEIMDNPELLTAKEAAKLLSLAMKAQDSRINALSKLSEEGRKVNEAKQNALRNAAFSNGDIT